jgi:HD-GYP domain-containing protein (c-di-GMP phosphodiesterase class II)
MSDALRYLGSLAQALAKMSLYAAEHPERARASDESFAQLRRLQRSDPSPSFSFIGREVIYQRRTLRGMSEWDWAERLSAAGVQRVDFGPDTSPEEYRVFLEGVFIRLAAVQSSSMSPTPLPGGRTASIRFGTVGFRDDMDASEAAVPAPETDLEDPDLSEEAESMVWMHQEVRDHFTVPMAEAEIVVSSLANALRREHRTWLPLLTLKEFDQYTTTHALNVAVLAMGLAEYLGLSRREAKAYGLAGLLHDVGKVRVPVEILRNPGALTAEETAVMRRHPVDGAKIILAGHPHHETCAVVAYEHHLMLDGSGYPARSTKRGCHHASLLVHVCDVFDALRTNRPYRVAWETPAIISYVESRMGSEFDVDAARGFVRMMTEWETRTARARSLDVELRAPALI